MPRSAEIFYEHGKKYNYRTAYGKPYWRQSRSVGGKVRTFYGDGEKDCLTKIKEAEDAAASGLILDYKNLRVEDAMRKWLYHIKRIDHDLKASSFARYEMQFRNHISGKPIAKTIVSKLNSSIAQEYVNDLCEKDGCSVASIKYTLRVWKGFIQYALDEGFIGKDPFKNISIPGKREKSKRRKIETFTAEERAAITKAMVEDDYWYKDLILLGFATGMRQGELLGLQYKDIRDNGIYVSRSTAVVTHVDGSGKTERYREVWDTKTENSERFIPLTPRMLELLNEHRIKQAEYFLSVGKELPTYVFVTNQGNLVDSSSFSKSYHRLLERAGVPYRKFHALRHTFATEAIRNGVNIKDLQMLMGHSDIQTTLIYVHSDDESKRKAMEKMENVIAF